MVDGKFGTAINCIDGRTQDPISHWIKENYSIDYVDTITEPGSDKALSEKNIDKIAQIKAKVLISINAHGSKLIVVSGHYDCAANSKHFCNLCYCKRVWPCCISFKQISDFFCNLFLWGFLSIQLYSRGYLHNTYLSGQDMKIFEDTWITPLKPGKS